MMLRITESWLVDSLVLVALLLYLLYWYLTRDATYFKDRGIPYLKPTPFIGNRDLFRKSQFELAQILYNSLPDEKFFGYFHARVPTLLVKDADLVQRVMVKDFAHFHDRGFKFVEGDVLSKNLFSFTGKTWRFLRNKLTPTFTSGKLKYMFSQFDKSGENLLENIENKCVSGEPVDAKLLSVNFVTEVVASTAFGLDFTKDNPQTIEFVERVRTAFISGFRLVITNILFLFAPKIASILRLGFFTPESIEYFFNLTKATIKYRRQNNVRRGDFLQQLMDVQENEENGTSVLSTTDYNDEDALINQVEFMTKSFEVNTQTKFFTDEILISQAIGFLAGGSDTVSATLSFVLYFIAVDQTIQERLVEEIYASLAKHNVWTYQAIKEMTYLDQVIKETMRLYPGFPLTLRECTIPYPIPGSEIVLEKGTIVAIPVAGLHMDPKYYPSPEVFKPERFADNNYKPNSKYMPFGDGPRICIGMRFAIVEMKVFLAKILAHYSVYIDSKTKQPLTIDRTSFTPRAEGGIWITFKKRE